MPVREAVYNQSAGTIGLGGWVLPSRQTLDGYLDTLINRNRQDGETCDSVRIDVRSVEQPYCVYTTVSGWDREQLAMVHRHDVLQTTMLFSTPEITTYRSGRMDAPSTWVTMYHSSPFHFEPVRTSALANEIPSDQISRRTLSRRYDIDYRDLERQFSLTPQEAIDKVIENMDNETRMYDAARADLRSMAIDVDMGMYNENQLACIANNISRGGVYALLWAKAMIEVSGYKYSSKVQRHWDKLLYVWKMAGMNSDIDYITMYSQSRDIVNKAEPVEVALPVYIDGRELTEGKNYTPPAKVLTNRHFRGISIGYQHSRNRPVGGGMTVNDVVYENCVFEDCTFSTYCHGSIFLNCEWRGTTTVDTNRRIFYNATFTNCTSTSPNIVIMDINIPTLGKHGKLTMFMADGQMEFKGETFRRFQNVQDILNGENGRKHSHVDNFAINVVSYSNNNSHTLAVGGNPLRRLEMLVNELNNIFYTLVSAAVRTHVPYYGDNVPEEWKDFSMVLATYLVNLLGYKWS